MTITETNRARTIWILVAITAAYGLVNVLMFYTTDSFGPVWFATSLAVYGALLAAGVVLALIDTGPEAAEEATPEPEAVAATDAAQPAVPEGPSPGLELLKEEVLYEVATGKLVRAQFQIDGSERSLLFVITPDEVLPLDAVEERLDTVEHRVPPEDVTDEIDAAVKRRVQAARDEPERREETEAPETQTSTIEVSS